MNEQDDIQTRAKSFYKQHCNLLPALLGWFSFSTALSSYNKFVFGHDEMHFPCPLFLTSIHFGSQWAFSYSITKLFPTFHGSKVIDDMSWKTFLWISIPCGFVTCADIGMSNLALVYITLTFYTMVKASSPIFVVGSAFLFGLEKFRWSLIGVVLIIICGEYLTVIGEKVGVTAFNWLGFFLCLGATICSGLRWTVVQYLLHSLEPPLKSSVTTMRLLSPSMFFFMVVSSMIIERPWIPLGPSADIDYFEDFAGTARTLGIGLLGAVLAIAMLTCEFFMILKTNAIVLMICGVLKEMLTIFVGHFFFADELNAIKVIGGCVAFTGVILYKVTSYYEKQSQIEYETVVDSQNPKPENKGMKRELLEGESIDDVTFAIVGNEEDDTSYENGDFELTKSDHHEKLQII